MTKPEPNPKGKTRTIVIAGGGTAGWMAAAALARFTDRRIVLVESDAIGTVGVGEATIPQIRLFNAGLGIDEGEFLRETQGSYKLGIEFAGWSGEASRYMHAFGPVGAGSGLVPFHHYWLRARQAGEAGPLADYSLNERAARANRMAQFEGGQGAPDLPWAYHFDAGLYAAMLRRFAEAHGVERVEGLVADVELDGENGHVSSLSLAGGERISGDFFIDCTGFRALLIEGALEAGWEDWSHWLPCDSAMAVPCENGGEFTPYTRAMAHEAGWQWRIPLQHRIGNGLVYCSDYLSEELARERLLADLDGKPQAEPRKLAFRTGMRARQWIGNCLALGLSAGFMEPLESTSIHLVQSSIARFLQMLPAEAGAPAVVEEFNRQAAFEWSRIRDFLILHYWANRREGEAFWDRCRAMDLPDTLAAKIDQFKAAAFIHREHEELFTPEGWMQVFIGQGVMPNAYSPLADTISESALAAMLRRISSQQEAVAARMPDHGRFLAARCAHQAKRKSA